MYKPIRDYAIIGNLRSAVLISKDGSIDWAPAPFIDSPSVFCAILDDKKGGSWSIRPKGDFEATQHYIPNTNILITTFTMKNGVVELIDFIPIEKEKTFLPAEKDTTFKIHRKVMCKKGECELEVIFYPKFDYARGTTTLLDTDAGITVNNLEKRGVLASSVSFHLENDKAIAHFKLKANESKFFVFRYNAGTVPFYRDDEAHHNEELEKTTQFWRDWAAQCDVDVCAVEGPWHDCVVRSSLVLKILFFEPVGTVAAAATTSLPEEIGGVRNWDYRFTWLRDSSFIFNAFFRLGHTIEAEEYIRWLLNECYDIAQSSPAHLQIMYGLRGKHRLKEEILTHLDGYKGSRPVRIGNNAYVQSQWDVYGSIFDVIWNLHQLRGGNAIEEKHWKILSSIADYVTHIWQQPDEGLWEVRGGKDHFVYSKVMCWVALDRALKIADAYSFSGNTESWEKNRDAIFKEVMQRGWNEKIPSFTQSLDGNNLDAAVLLLPVVGFIQGDDPKMLATIRAIQKTLARGDGLLLRYTSYDGLPGKEGAFLLASFWLVDALILAGEVKEAEELFKKLVAQANHVGLYSEEINPETDEFLGNFPQAYTHIGLINSAMMLTEALQHGS